jgi:hypothetical protein
MSLNEKVSHLVNLLYKHDWSFEFSDDHGVWKRGCNSFDELKAAMKEANKADSEEATKIFWDDYIGPIADKFLKQCFFGKDNFGYYEWLRSYLPNNHLYYKI